jgi:hypothetical protein
MIKNIHLVTYAEGVNRVTDREYSTTQKLLIESIESNTKYNVIYHTHNLKTIKEKEWFDKISNFPNINFNKDWDRAGYYNAWKPFLVSEVYELMGDADILYYVDSSGYHQQGFEYNIDSLIEYAYSNKNVCGSFGHDVKNNSYNCCDDVKIWDIIYTNMQTDINEILSKPHILNSWLVFSKNKENSDFINEWVSFVNTQLNDIPLIAYHHTVDQSLFNILVYKYGFKCFFNNKTHDENKNHNLVHMEIQNMNKHEIQNYFINPINFNI